MKATSLRRALVVAALLTISPAAAVAQADVKERAEDLSEQANGMQREADALANDVADSENVPRSADGRNDRADNDDGFDWGLLGLLGLAGLLGLTRRDDRRVRADGTRDTGL